ncbi:MAG: C25 family cysteine peptidase [Bacteroidales bacterium]|nr:C25 family cysteine peptidase [Bacteroidales bacterium]
MKKIVLIIVLLVSFGWANASDWVQVSGNQVEASHISLVKSAQNSTTLQYALSGYSFSEINTEKGQAIQIECESGAPILRAGAPGLPLFSTSLIIPNRAYMEVNIVSSSYKEYRDVLIVPSKGNLTRDIDPATVPYTFGKQYAQDAFYPGEVVTLRDPYIIRDFRGQTVLIQPFQYNPVTHVLRVYYDITLEVVENGPSTVNILDKPAKPEMVNTQFNQIYKRHFLNYQSSDRYTPLEEEGNMLIICYGAFMDSIQPFVDWKIRKGIPVEVVDVATIGSSSAIKTYIADYYNNNGLAFVLLVGDSQQVPSSVVGGNDSDNNYTYIVGSDHYPDVFCGRFSAETAAQVATQVHRTLEYEQTPIADTSWYKKAIGIASDQGPGDDNEYDYQHIRNIGNNKLLPYTYNYAYEYFDGSQGGNDAAGSPTPTMVATGINSGATIINYTGHGSDNAWSSSGFSSSNVNQLTNTGKLPFIFSVACVNGNFVNASCFAEAWMRAEDNGQPTGAIATLMSTINQSWNPPMGGQDEMNDILTEAYSNNIKRTFAGISMNGCMQMNDQYGSAGDEMTDTWTVFGDPSVVIRTSYPQNMLVTHPTELHLGETSMVLTCNAEGAKAALSLNGVILGTAIVSGGSATITFPALTDLGMADLVVSGYNYIPYITTIEIIPELGPYMGIAGKVINDAAGGNGNGLMDYGEDILLTMSLTNVGVEDGYGVSSILSSTSPFITITSDSANFGDLAVGDTVTISDAFAFSVSNDLANMSLVPFRLTSSDQDGNEWISNFMIPGHSGKLAFIGYGIDDASGNNNGKLDVGETANILLSIKNTGSSDAYQVMTQLTSESSYVTVNSAALNFGDIVPGATTTVAFNVTAAGDTPAGYAANFTVQALGNLDLSMTDSFYTIVGQIPVLIVNMANVASSDSMMNCLQNLQVGGEVMNALPTDLEIYSSIFVLLGSYPDNHVLTTAEGDALAAYLNNGGRCYMEGGDTWAYDNQTAAHALFFIDGYDDGEGDLGTITGDEANFLAGFTFEYDGVNSYIDHIQPLPGGDILMSNTSPEYVTAVSYHNDTYKTVGAVFQFAGLANNGGSHKDGVMAQILNFFGVSFTWTGVNETSALNMGVTTFPNPFNDQVTLKFNLLEKAAVSLEVFDLTGRMVYSTESKVMNTGLQTLIWNVQNNLPGIYTYRLKAGRSVVTNKIVRIN